MSEEKETTPPEESAPVAQTGASVDENAPVSEAEHGDQHDVAGVEPESVNTKLIFGIVGVTSMVILVLILVGFTITKVYSRQTQERLIDEATYSEIREVHAAATEELNASGVVDAEAGIYRVPVDRAMELMIQQEYRNPSGNYSGEVRLLPSQ